jgi:hypothetical protein
MPARVAGSGPLQFRGISDLVTAFGRIPDSLRKELRPEIRAAGMELADDMRRRASYSSRIPGAIGVRAAFQGRMSGVTIRTDRRKAPHARPLEVGSQGAMSSTFRHPAFGNREVWVTQRTRPFFFPAVAAGHERLRSRIEKAVEAAQREVQ